MPDRPPGMDRPVPNGRARLLAGSMAATFVVIRTWLYLRPDADFNIGPYNIHHLYTGVLIAAVCGIPLVVRAARGRVETALVAGFGLGLCLALDEVVYLIVTDGSNRSYLLQESFAGGLVLVGAACGYALALIRRARASC